jgi:hypothetical protein
MNLEFMGGQPATGAYNSPPMPSKQKINLEKTKTDYSG